MKRKNLLIISLSSLLFFLSLTDGYSQWTLAGQVASAGTFPSISVVDQNTVWVAGGIAPNPTVARTTNGGTNWTVIPTTGITLELYCIWAVDANTAFVGDGGASGGLGGNARFYKTTNAGQNWTLIASTGGTGGFFNGIVFSKINPNFGIAQSDPPAGLGQPYYVSVTTDGGVTWTITNPPGNAGAASAQNSIVVIDDQFYGFGLNAGPGRVDFTSNGGSNWNTRTVGLTSTNNFTSGFAMSDNKLNGIAALESSLPNIARTTDGGLTWATVNVGTGFTGYCTCKWIEGTRTCYISAAVGGTGVVKKSTDAGVTWTTMSTFGLTGITHMEFRRVGTNVYGYAATSNGAILKVTDVVTEVISTNNTIPVNYELEQNFPNPFNPTTTINFSIPILSNVTLKIYDVLGNEVTTLLKEQLNTGNYSTFFNASGYASGVYYYKINIENGEKNFSQTQKMILTK